ncbi:MAG: type 1 glutamine amidotransferase [Armatimonadetes bacterium]|nr:MAG: type 1 glutamine amidotransferase [Armatimonadota bacterium]
MRILVLENDPVVPPGRLATEAATAGHEIVMVRLHQGDRIDDAGHYDAIVVLGGGMGSYEEDAYPFLVDEKQFLVEAVDRGVPVLGLCLGSQLLADALGGRVYLADTPEVQLCRAEIEVEDDPVAMALGSTDALLFHRDTFVLPPGATVLAKTTDFIHAFRIGSGVGVQAHPEVTRDTALAWIDSPESADIVEGAGVDRAELRARVAGAEEALSDLATSFFSAWFAEAESLLDSSVAT